MVQTIHTVHVVITISQQLTCNFTKITHTVSGSPTSRQISQWLQCSPPWLLMSGLSSHFFYYSVFSLLLSEASVTEILSKWLQDFNSLGNHWLYMYYNYNNIYVLSSWSELGMMKRPVRWIWKISCSTLLTFVTPHGSRWDSAQLSVTAQCPALIPARNQTPPLPRPPSQPLLPSLLQFLESPFVGHREKQGAKVS